LADVVEEELDQGIAKPIIAEHWQIVDNSYKLWYY
jgi:hypothetical protein